MVDDSRTAFWERVAEARRAADSVGITSLTPVWDRLDDIRIAEPEDAGTSPGDDPVKLRFDVERTADVIIDFCGKEEAAAHARQLEASLGDTFAKMVRVEIERRQRSER